MKKIIALIFTILLAFSVTISASAISPKATNRVDIKILPDSIVKVGKPLSMEADEIITINCTYSPRTADVDFGLITPQNTFISVPGENGDCNQTIRINRTGKYYFAVRNNSGYAVEILGYVYY